MMSSGLDFVLNEEIKYDCGTILTKEEFCNLKQEYFNAQLSDEINLNQKALVTDLGDHVEVNGEKFDYCIDCTWGHLKPDKNFFFESTILLYYRAKTLNRKSKALTFVDGPLCSLYPTEKDDIYTLSSVLHTPIGLYENSKD